MDALLLPEYDDAIEIVDNIPVAPIVSARCVIVLLADAATDAALRAWCHAWGFDLTASYGGEQRDENAFDFHLTLVASANVVDLVPCEFAIAEPITVAEPDRLDALGADHDVPVLTIDDVDGMLATLRTMFIDEFGIEPTFADFRPHVSLSYAWDGVSPSIDEPVPDMGPLTFDRIRIAVLD